MAIKSLLNLDRPSDAVRRELMAALELLKAGRVDEIDTLRMLEIAEQMSKSKLTYWSGMATEIASGSIPAL